MFKSMKKSLDKLGQDVTKGVDSVGKSVEDTMKGKRAATSLDFFRTGNVLCLISRSSGHSLQIVTASDGKLVMDGKGPDDINALHAHWTIINDGKNLVRLHNKNNFLAATDGAVHILHFDDVAKAGAETQFRVSLCGQFITLESVKHPGHHVGILSTGELKPAVATGKENDGQYGVKLIYTPYTDQQGGSEAAKQGATSQ